jgi:hypothetical protein
MGSHRSVARSSLHTSSLAPTPCSYPPHTTSPGRVLRNSFAPKRDSVHTLISRHASTNPRCSAKRAHISGRAATRGPAQLSSCSSAVVVGLDAMIARVTLSGARVAACVCERSDDGTLHQCWGKKLLLFLSAKKEKSLLCCAKARSFRPPLTTRAGNVR